MFRAQSKIAQSSLWVLALMVIVGAYPGGIGEAQEGPNLLPPLVLGDPGQKLVLPPGWHREDRQIPGVEASKIYISRDPGHSGELLAVVGGPDRGGCVWCQVSGIRPQTDYTLKFLAFRPKFTNGVYFEVEIFGQRHLINQHFSYGKVQPIILRVNSREVRGSTRLVIENPHQEILAFGAPSLRIGPVQKTQRQSESIWLPAFFPVGIYGAGPDDLPAIRAAGFNAIQSYDSRPGIITRLAALSANQGLKYLANMQHYQEGLSEKLGGQPELLGFYIEDEPEGRSVPPVKPAELGAALKKDHPGVLTALAMLRPQMVTDYRDAADIFMIDPYPVPDMPMTWLSDCIEEAGRSVSKERLWAVIQAFGGDKWAQDGWPRRPLKVEMRCLSYLAVVHGARGIFYFSYPEVSSDPAAWQDLQGVVRELQDLQPWLVLPNLTSRLRLEMTSPFKVDATGRPAVHFCEKQQGHDHLLVLVNVINHPVSFYLQGFSKQIGWVEEKFLHQKSVVRDGNIREELGPYEVRIYKFALPG